MNRCRPAAAMLTAPALALALSLPLAGVAEGAVTASTADGFTLVIEVDVKAPPPLAYRELTGGPAAWWDPERTYSGKAERLTLDARASIACDAQHRRVLGQRMHQKAVDAAVARMQCGMVEEPIAIATPARALGHGDAELRRRPA